MTFKYKGWRITVGWIGRTDRQFYARAERGSYIMSSAPVRGGRGVYNRICDAGRALVDAREKATSPPSAVADTDHSQPSPLPESPRR